jgi:hypothetical protein
VSLTEASYAGRAGLGQWVARFAEQQSLRLQVRWSQWSLDERLASGVDPGSDPALLLRARQLRSQRHRSRLATWVERLVDESDAPQTAGLTSKVPIVREKVAEARESLLAVAELLRHGEQLRPRGIAMVERLLTDGESPLYRDAVRGAVALQVRAALNRMVGEQTATAIAVNRSPTHNALDPR